MITTLHNQTTMDWRTVSVSNLNGKPAHAQFKGYGLEQYGVISGVLTVDAGGHDVIIRPSEQDGYPKGVFFPVGTVNTDTNRLQLLSTVQSLTVWEKEPAYYHTALTVTPVPVSKLMIGEEYDSDGTGDTVNSGSNTTGDNEPTDSDPVYNAAIADIDNIVNSDPTADSDDTSEEPLTDDDINNLINKLSMDPEVQSGLRVLGGRMEKFNAQVHASNEEYTRDNAGYHDDTTVNTTVSNSNTDDTTIAQESYDELFGALLSEEYTPLRGSLMLTVRNPSDNSIDYSSVERIANATGKRLVSIPANNCREAWSPQRTRVNGKPVDVFSAGFTDVFTGNAILVITGLQLFKNNSNISELSDEQIANQLLARKVIKTGGMWTFDNGLLPVHDNTLIIGMVEPPDALSMIGSILLE